MRSFWLPLALVCGQTAALAQLPVARLTALFPPGGMAGTTLEVKITGSDLDEPAHIHFSHPGIRAALDPATDKFSVAIASNVPPGRYEARFVGRFGISNPRAFMVGQLREAVTPTTNTSLASAGALLPNTTVNGRANPNAIAWFKFEAKQGERLFIECLAKPIDSRMDPLLILSYAEGREIERSRTGGLIDFTAPADSSCLLRVSDFLYRGGDEYFYRLALSKAPRIDFVMPPAALPGTRTRFTLYGRNLPGGETAEGLSLEGKSLEKLAVEIDVPTEVGRGGDTAPYLAPPAAAVVDAFEYRLPIGDDAPATAGTGWKPVLHSHPVLIGFATAPVVLEEEPNNTAAQAHRLSPPCEVAGQFYPAGDADWFTFEAKKGEVLWIELFSHRLGVPTDPFVLVQRVRRADSGEERAEDLLELYDNDTNLGGTEFNTASRDPAARFEAPADGVYRVQARDLFNRIQASPRHVYRLALRRAAPDFRLVAQTLVPKYKADAKNIDIGVPLLRRGETIAVRVMAFRRDGFNGAIDLSLEAPPPGLIFAGDRLEGGQSSDFILLTAAEDAPAFAGPVQLVGKAKVGQEEITRQCLGGTIVFPVSDMDKARPESRVARDFTLAISDKESAPISIVAERKAWEAAANEKIEIPFRVTRRGDFAAGLKLKPLGPGSQDALKEFEVDGKATNATLKLDLAALKLAPGSYIFALQSTTPGKYRNNPEAAALAEAAAQEAEKLAAAAAAAAKKAAEQLEQATKAALEVEAAATSDKPADAQGIGEKSRDDQGHKPEGAGARKTASEAAAAAEARAEAEKTHRAAEKSAKEAQAKKEQLARRAKELSERAKPREVSYQVTSAPVFLEVTPAKPAESKQTK